MLSKMVLVGRLPCKALGINPFEWLKYVLLRIHTHPMSRIKELLPQNYNAAIAVQS
jgi:hypothetical protein